MNVLVIDEDGVGLAFCFRAQLAGHDVRLFLKPKPCINQKIGDGFKGITKVNNWVGSIKWADLVFMTSNADYLKRLDFFKKNGVMVYAPSEKSAELEINRKAGMEFLKKHGIEVAPYKTFKTLEDAKRHVEKTEERFVFKTMGDNEDKSLSYCAKSPADMIERINHWIDRKMNPKGEVMLQTFIEGIEFGVGRWMGTKGFIGMFDEHFEHKKLMSSNAGPNTGEMGTVQAYTKESKLGQETLMKMEADLVEMGFLSEAGVNFIIDKKGKPWPLEFTCRPGWPAFNIQLSQHKGDPCQWMLDALRGKDTFEAITEVAVGILIAQPPFPSEGEQKDLEDIPVYGVTKKNMKYIQPQAIMITTKADMEVDKIVKRPIWTTAGDYLAVVTGVADSVEKAAKRAYGTVDELFVPNMIFRDDIGEKTIKQLPELHKFGYATNFK